MLYDVAPTQPWTCTAAMTSTGSPLASAARMRGDYAEGGGGVGADAIGGRGLEEEESLARFLKACAFIRFGGVAKQVHSG